MSSSEQTQVPPQQQQQTKVEKIPSADWPTIKIFLPPQGPLSPKSDEWCLIYCSQSVTNRIHMKQPNCRSLCIRKVFPHEVRNILYFKRHGSVGPDGKAKYPLPKEGQSINLPRLLGGTLNSESGDRPQTKYWDEGWYFWTGGSRWAAIKETNTMMLDLQKQKQAELNHKQVKDVWHDYQEHLKHGVKGADQQQQSQWWGPIVPPRPNPDTSSVSLLVPLPPDFPIFEKISKFLKPTRHVLNLMRESFVSGEQKRFALRVWEKAKSNEPFIFAQRTLAYGYEQWKRWDASNDGSKDAK